jgi:hypothetical protein
MQAVGALALDWVLYEPDAVSGGYVDAGSCADPSGPVAAPAGPQDIAPELRDAFVGVLGDRLGFRLARHPDRAIGHARGAPAADYLLRVDVRSIRYSLCRSAEGAGGTTGTAEATFAFQVLNRKTGRIVHDGRITSAGALSEPRLGRVEPALLARSFENALMHLAADNGFRRALVGGLPDSDALHGVEVAARPGWDQGPSQGGSFSGWTPPGNPGGGGYGAAWVWPGSLPAVQLAALSPAADGAGSIRPPQPPMMVPGGGGVGLTVTGPPLFLEPMAVNVEAIRDATVTVLAPDRHGSGFFISRDGWMLTGAHVVAGRDVFRVRLADGREPWARVERRHAARDVALLRVSGQGFPALPLRPTVASVSETVYAISTPVHQTLGQTVSRGIISAYQPGGPWGLDAYQATAPVHAGASGGPLVDSWGNVVAVTSAAVAHPGGGPPVPGLGFFIPVHDALASLGIRVITPSPGRAGVQGGGTAGPLPAGWNNRNPYNDPPRTPLVDGT